MLMCAAHKTHVMYVSPHTLHLHTCHILIGNAICVKRVETLVLKHNKSNAQHIYVVFI